MSPTAKQAKVFARAERRLERQIGSGPAPAGHDPDLGALLAAINAADPAWAAADRPWQASSWIALLERHFGSARLVQEKHRRDSSSLLLRLGAAGPNARELVVFFSRAPASAPSLWWYPHDPVLPALGRLAQDAGCVRDLRWERPWLCLFPQDAPITGRRLSYYPGQRAAFLLSAPHSAAQVILKIVRPEAFAGCLERQRALESTSLGYRIVMPRMLSFSTRACALVYEYLPGTPLQEVETDQLPTDALAAQLGTVLAEIHQTMLPAIPQWSPARETAAIRELIDEIERQPGTSAIRPLFERLAARLAQAERSYHHLIHNDFSARNILFHPAGFNPPLPGMLAVVDWDSASLGPPERDIAACLGGRAQAAIGRGPVLDAYRERTGQPLDLDLANTFMQYQRLLKLCRRTMRDGADASTNAAVDAIAARLDNNPLAE